MVFGISCYQTGGRALFHSAKCYNHSVYKAATCTYFSLCTLFLSFEFQFALIIYDYLPFEKDFAFYFLSLLPPSHVNALYKLWRLDKFGPVILMKWQKYNFRRQTDRRLTIAHLNLRCADKKHVCLKKNLRPLVLNLYELGIFTNFLSIIVFCITNYQKFMFMILNDIPCKRGN